MSRAVAPRGHAAAMAVGPRGRAAVLAIGTLSGAIVALVLGPAAVMAAPVVTDADVRIVFLSPTSCTVDLVLGVEADTVEHRIDVAEGADIELLNVRGARLVGDPREVGRTRALVVEPEADGYSLSYRVNQPPSRTGRCPLWIPTIPTAGRGRVVRITVRIPPGAAVRGSMPSFEWAGDEGSTAIGHLPAFVRVPYALPGEPVPWNVARIMDVTAVAVLVAATVAWTRRRAADGRAAADGADATDGTTATDGADAADGRAAADGADATDGTAAADGEGAADAAAAQTEHNDTPNR